MKIVELEINIMAVPQGYYLAQGISRDLNFKVGLPAAFEKTYSLKEKLTDKYDEIECGETYLIDNVYSLVVKIAVMTARIEIFLWKHLLI